MIQMKLTFRNLETLKNKLNNKKKIIRKIGHQNKERLMIWKSR